MFNGWYFFWLICPVYILVTPMAFLLSMIWDHKNFKEDMTKLKKYIVKTFHKVVQYLKILKVKKSAAGESDSSVEHSNPKEQD